MCINTSKGSTAEGGPPDPFVPCFAQGLGQNVLVACQCALFSPAKNTMQLFMWQRNIVGVAHFVQDCFEVLGALDDAPDDASTSSSSALAAG